MFASGSSHHCARYSGATSVERELPAGATVADLLASLQQETPKLLNVNTLHTAINQRYVQSDATLSDGDEVAILPPVSGGCADSRFRITEQPSLSTRRRPW